MPSSLTLRFTLVAVYTLLLSPAFAEDDLVNDGESYATSCARIKKYADLGAQHYREKAWTKARDAFENQAALADYCAGNQDLSAEATIDHQRAIAYNNVALTYLRQKQYAWAFAWANLAPDDKNSRHNLALIRPHLASLPKKIDGAYVRYAGQGTWSVVTVRKAKQTYEIEGELYWIGAVYRAPNMGDFWVSMPLNQRAIQFFPNEDINRNCEISIHFGENRLTLKTSGSVFSCGFGANVVADGEFLRIGDRFVD